MKIDAIYISNVLQDRLRLRHDICNLEVYRLRKCSEVGTRCVALTQDSLRCRGILHVPSFVRVRLNMFVYYSISVLVGWFVFPVL